MASFASPALRFCFSIFKKKVAPLRTGAHNTPEQLYSSLNAFESQLTALEVKKMPKALESFARKFRRLLKKEDCKAIAVPMQLSQTYEAYTRNVDELTFGNEQLQVQTTLEGLLQLSSVMVRWDLDVYLGGLLASSEAHRSLYLRLQERFVNIEERVSREAFRGYMGFSRNVSKIAFLEEREYRGDFQFQLVEDRPRVELAVAVMYNCAMFGQLRDKLALACELAMTRWTELGDETLGRLLFCLANAGRSLKLVEENYFAIRERVEREYPLQLLYYMLVSGLEDGVWFQALSGQLTLVPRNVHEQSLACMIKIVLSERFQCSIAVEERAEFAREAKLHDGQRFFQDFLARYGYEYTSSPLSLFPYTLYTIQGRLFVVYDGFAVRDEQFKLGGPGLIIAQHFHERGQGLKHINWPRMLGMDKRGERDEYLLSKFKGMERPKRVKVRYYQ